MPNNYFQFKQFTIHQDRCAMKVCTDACLFGGWIGGRVDSWEMTDDRREERRVLDIGAGTGLLSLMLAQKVNAFIDAIEINADAALQAAENFNASPWSERLAIHHQPIQEWAETNYDLIISNPPFFEQDLKSPNTERNLALHDTGLTLEILWLQVVKCLHSAGQFAILLPAHRLADCISLATKHEFYLWEEVQVHQTEKHSPFRVMLWFGRNEIETKRSSMVIKENGVYTDRFCELLKDYYLRL